MYTVCRGRGRESAEEGWRQRGSHFLQIDGEMKKCVNGAILLTARNVAIVALFLWECMVHQKDFSLGVLSLFPPLGGQLDIKHKSQVIKSLVWCFM